MGRQMLMPRLRWMQTPKRTEITKNMKSMTTNLLASLAALGCEILTFPGSGRVPLSLLLAELSRRGVTNLLVEGGGQVLGAFLDAGQVDAVDVYIAPALEGGSHPFGPARGLGRPTMVAVARLDRHEVTRLDGDIRLQGTLPASWHVEAP